VCYRVCCRVCCSMWCRVVPCVAVEHGRDEIIMMISHCNSVLQYVAAWCRVLQCTAYSPCTTCHVLSLATHALLPLAV